MPNAEWPRVLISTVCISITDCVNRTAPTVGYTTPYKMIRTTNVKNGGIDTENVKYVSEETYKRWTRREVPKLGDVILTREAPLGEVGMIRNHDTIFLGQRLVSYRADPAKLDARFLLYSFLQSDLQGQVRALGSGATVEHMRVPDAKKLTISLPPLPVQKRIADILSAYDDLIENNTRRIQILEEMAQAIYREWFVHFRYPGHEGARMVPSEMGEIPEGWDYHSIGNVLAHHINGGWGEDGPSKDFSEPAYVIRGTDIPRARVGDISECPLRFHKPSNLKTRKLQNLDIVLEVSGGSKGQPVGRPLLIYDQLLNQFDADAICASFCKLMRPEQNIIHSEILYLHIREIYSDGRIDKYQTQSTGIINFKSQYFLDNELMIVPTRELQKQFILKVRPMFELIQTLGHKNANLRQQRDLLLPRLVSGEIEVC
jgi:type I restriction enzyme S subunit